MSQILKQFLLQKKKVTGVKWQYKELLVGISTVDYSLRTSSHFFILNYLISRKATFSYDSPSKGSGK